MVETLLGSDIESAVQLAGFLSNVELFRSMEKKMDSEQP